MIPPRLTCLLQVCRNRDMVESFDPAIRCRKNKRLRLQISRNRNLTRLRDFPVFECQFELDSRPYGFRLQHLPAREIEYSGNYSRLR